MAYIKKWSLIVPHPPFGAWTPMNVDKEKKPHLDVISHIARIQTRRALFNFIPMFISEVSKYRWCGIKRKCAFLNMSQTCLQCKVTHFLRKITLIIFKKITKPQNNVFYGRLWFLNLTNHSIEVFLFHTD